MRELAKILLLIILLPVAVGQVVEPTKKEKVEEGLQIRVTGVPLAEQSPTHSHYTVDEDGMITMLKLGKVQTKGKSHSVLAKEIADAYVQAGIYKDPVVVVLGGAEEVEESWIVCESSSAWTTAEEQAKAENGSSTSVTLASFVKAHFGAKAYDNIGQVRLVRDNRGFSLNLMVDEHKNVKLDPKDRVQVSRKRLIPWTEVELSVIAVPTADNQRVTGRHKVAEDGTITMWKIGKVDTKGKTADQLAVDLKEAYVGAEIFKDPVFIVSGQPLVERQVNRKFLNLGRGAVRDGDCRIPWVEGLTLEGAVESVGWNTKRGYSKWVKLHRFGRVYTYNLMIKKHRNLKTYPGDLVEVVGAKSKKPEK